MLRRIDDITCVLMFPEGKGRGSGADVRGTNAGNRFGDEQAMGKGDDQPLPEENSGVDGPMDETGRTHNPVTRAEDLNDGTNFGNPDLDIAGFDEDNYSMGTDPKAVGDKLDQVEIPHGGPEGGEGEGEGRAKRR